MESLILKQSTEKDISWDETMKKKFLFICFLLIFISSIFAGVISNIYILDTYKRSMYHSLSSQGEVLKKFLEYDSSSEINLYRLAYNFSTHTGVRISFLDSEGNYLADSHDNSVIFMKPQKDRNLIQWDLRKKTKVMKFFTTPIEHKNRRIIVALSKEMEEYYRFEKNVIFIIVASIFVSAIMCIPFTLISVHKITTPIVQEIREKAQNMESILNGVSEGIILLDREGSILEINRAAKKIIGYEDTNTCFSTYRSRLDQLGDSLKISKFPIKDFSERLILVIEDISKIKKLENIRKEFVTNASHELKTPLTIISGFLETISLKNYRNQEQLFHFIGIIEKETTKLKKLTENLLALTTEENPHINDIKPQILDISEFGNKMIDRFRSLAEKKEILLELVYEEKQRSLSLPFGEKCLEIIVSNLVENALKYTEDRGKVSLTILPGEEALLISVQDTGKGIAKEEISKIFEKFYRVDKSRSNQIEGMGLGLSIVEHMVHMVEGEIEVISNVNQGSIFTVKIKYLKGKYI